MALRAAAQYRLVGGGLMGLTGLLGVLLAGAAVAAEASGARDTAVAAESRVAEVQGGIAEAERHQREILSAIYTIGRDIKDAVRRTGSLTQRMLGLESSAKDLAREVRELEDKSAERGRLLDARLNSLYRRRASGAGGVAALFSSTSPAALNRHQKFLRAMIEDDHRHLELFVAGLREAKLRRQALRRVVGRLVDAQRRARGVEEDLARRMDEKASLVAKLRSTRETSLNTLRRLREAGAAGEFAFFERRGQLTAPVAVSVAQGYGAFIDPEFRFRLMHKGWFFAGRGGLPVTAVADGTVGVARAVPGWGPTIVLDHGDHYYSVYAGAGRIKVREGARVVAGEVIGSTGEHSPLFGPGLYFELRHFADAIDPRSWIKDPDFRTAERE